MAKIYIKTTWVDEVLVGAERYNILDNGGAAINSNVQIALATPVSVAGSGVTATRMNNLENGVDAIDTLVSNLLGGWIAGIGTWSYSSADAPSFVISINADVTGLIELGDRVKYTQTTVKYGIVTKIGTFSGGVTLVTIYGGTDYALTNAAITLPYYSHSKSPFGFPMDIEKWSVVIRDATDSVAISPTVTANNYYQFGTAPLHQISVPIGKWRLGFVCLVTASIATTQTSMRTVLSTTGAGMITPSDNELAGYSLGMSGTVVRSMNQASRPISLTAKTVYNLLTATSTTGVTSLNVLGSTITTKIYAESLYL